MRGRIMSIYQLLFAGTTPIGGTFVGLLADKQGVGPAIVVAAALCVLGLGAGLAYLRFGPRPAPEHEEDAPAASPPSALNEPPAAASQ
jgi:hypothetical protein